MCVVFIRIYKPVCVRSSLGGLLTCMCEVFIRIYKPVCEVCKPVCVRCVLNVYVLGCIKGL